MEFSKIVEREYANVSEKVIDKVIFPKKDAKLQYESMSQATTYAKGVHVLQDSYKGNDSEVPPQLWYEVDGRKIVRPLTFRENIIAKIDDFETLKNKDGSTRTIDERLGLFDTWLDSCTAVLYSSNNKDDFMIIPVCKELITIPEDFGDEYIQVDYASLQGKGFVLKRSQAKYNRRLTELEMIYHPAWIAALEEDITLLCAYSSVGFNHMDIFRGRAEGFYLKTIIEKDQIKNMFGYTLYVASDTGNFEMSSEFLRTTSLVTKFV